MSILSVDNISPIGSGTSVTINDAATLVLNNVSVAGVSTFTGNIDANGDLDVDGHTNLDNTSIVGIVTISAGTNNEGLRITGQHNNCVIFTSPSINGSAGYRLNHHPSTNFLRIDTTDQNGTFTGIVASFSSAGLDMADNIKLRLGTSQDLTLYHYGNDAYIDNATGSILFRQGGSEKLRISSTGNVGINQTSPQRILHVGESGTAEANIRIQGGSDYGEIRVKDSDNELSFHHNVGGAGSRELFSSNGSTGHFSINCYSYEALTITTNENGTNGPELSLFHNSASPAASDSIAQIRFNAKDSAGNTDLYARIHANLASPTSGSESGDLVFSTRSSGTFAERLRINSSGIVTKPYTPMFIAGRTGGNQTFTVGTFPFNVTRVNVGNHYNTSTYKFTAPVAGVYYFHAQIYYNNGSGNYRVGFRKEPSGGSALMLNTAGHAMVGNDNTQTLSIIESLAVGDTVRLFSDQNASIQCYYNINDNTYGAHTYFMGYLIG